MVLNKRGFTLIELITVVVLLALMAIMIIPPVMDSIDKTKEYSYDEMVNNIESVTKIYISNHRDTISNINVKGSKVKISLQDLVDSGLLKAPIINPKTEDTISLETEVSVCVIDKNKFYISYENIVTCTQDSISPIVSFNINGSTTYANSRNIKVTIKDSNDIDNSSLKYLWTTSTTAPTEASFSDTFVNKGYVTSPTGVTGIYYLWILAKDTYNNVTISRSEAFYLDNISPTITMNGTTPITIDEGDTYTDAGATANDNIDGNITSNIQITSDVNVNVSGTYTVTYNVSDSAGNAATPVVRTVNVLLPDYIASKGVNRPKFTTGMTAIKWNSGTSTWDTVANPDTDTSWYSYDTTNKQWANAKTADGSMWVWIPRYVYKISSGWNSNIAGTMNIQFSMGTDDTRDGTVTLDTGATINSSNNKWTNHPAFTFGSTQLTGIWVAKFKSSSPSGSSCYTSANSTNCNVSNLLPKIIPGAIMWRYITPDNAFLTTRNMETNNTYGWGTSGNNIDTHLMKNTEWGAMAYLSISTYGKNGMISPNQDSNFYTGAGSGNAYATNILKSTTGNIYGIYDTGGNATELTAAYVNNGSSNLTSFGASIISADAKYKNSYNDAPYFNTSLDTPAENYRLAYYISIKGDAVYETSSSGSGSGHSWFSDTALMPSTWTPWFFRNGGYIFGFSSLQGTADSYTSFRPVLLIANGL